MPRARRLTRRGSSGNRRRDGGRRLRAASHAGAAADIPDRVRRHRSSSWPRPIPIRNMAACCAWASPTGRRISICTSRAPTTISAPWRCMFDNLIRRDPRDSGKTIIPDLAHSWEIAKDSKTYTFFLRKGMLFSDGAELTADDVKATFDRIVNPPEGISIPRSILFKCGQRDQRARQVHRSSSSWPRRGRPPSSCRRSPAAGTSSCARRRWRTTTTTCAR